MCLTAVLQLPLPTHNFKILIGDKSKDGWRSPNLWKKRLWAEKSVLSFWWFLCHPIHRATPAPVGRVVGPPPLPPEDAGPRRDALEQDIFFFSFSLQASFDPLTNKTWYALWKKENPYLGRVFLIWLFVKNGLDKSMVWKTMCVALLMNVLFKLWVKQCMFGTMNG